MRSPTQAEIVASGKLRPGLAGLRAFFGAPDLLKITHFDGDYELASDYARDSRVYPATVDFARPNANSGWDVDA